MLQENASCHTGKERWCCWRIRYSTCKFEVKWDKFRVLVVYCYLSVRESLLQMILKNKQPVWQSNRLFCFGWRLEVWKEMIEIFGPHKSIFFLIFLRKFWWNSDFMCTDWWDDLESYSWKAPFPQIKTLHFGIPISIKNININI